MGGDDSREDKRDAADVGRLIARCDQEIAEIRARPETTRPCDWAYLPTMGLVDWGMEKRLIMAATQDQVASVLRSDAFTDSEKWVVKWQFRLLGDFQTSLARAITQADEMNLERLHLGFPEEVDGFTLWSRGNLAERLRAAGLEL